MESLSSSLHNRKQTEAQSARAKSTHKGVNLRSKDVTRTQQQRPDSTTVALTCHACKYKVHELHQNLLEFMYIDVRLAEFMYLVFTRKPGESDCKRLG